MIPDANVNDISLLGLVKHTLSERLRLQAGIRYEWRNIHVPDQEAAAHSHEEEGHDEGHHLESFDRNYNNLTASVRATYNFTGQLLLRANLASAYRTPNLAELTQDGMHGVWYEQGNINLQSQRNYEADLSLHYHSSMLSFNLAGFYNKIDHYIYLAPTSDTAGNGADIYRYDQTDAVLGTKLAFRQNDPAMFETATDGYTLLHIGIGGQFKWSSQMIEWNLRVDNLLDEKYIDHLSTLKEVGFYNMGRNISLMVKVPFAVGGR